MRDVVRKAMDFYVDGFRRMTWGRELWWIILLKLVVLFVVLRLFFFKPVMGGMTEGEKAEHVAEKLTSHPKTP